MATAVDRRQTLILVAVINCRWPDGSKEAIYPNKLIPMKTKAENSQPAKNGSSICKGKHMALAP